MMFLVLIPHSASCFLAASKKAFWPNSEFMIVVFVVVGLTKGLHTCSWQTLSLSLSLSLSLPLSPYSLSHTHTLHTLSHSQIGFPLTSVLFSVFVSSSPAVPCLVVRRCLRASPSSQRTGTGSSSWLETLTSSTRQSLISRYTLHYTYSGTSDKGLSVLRTQYIKPLY